MMLRALIVILYTGIAVTLMWLGFQWIYAGYGLNPWVAFPIAAAFYLIPYAILLKEAEDADVRVEDLLEELDQRVQNYG